MLRLSGRLSFFGLLNRVLLSLVAGDGDSTITMLPLFFELSGTVLLLPTLFVKSVLSGNCSL